MRGHFKLVYILEVRICVWIQAVAKQLIYIVARELLRRQADAMDDQQRNVVRVRSVVVVRRSDLAGATQKVVANYHGFQALWGDALFYKLCQPFPYAFNRSNNT
jgi:hypothetical protein